MRTISTFGIAICLLATACAPPAANPVPTGDSGGAPPQGVDAAGVDTQPTADAGGVDSTSQPGADVQPGDIPATDSGGTDPSGGDAAVVDVPAVDASPGPDRTGVDASAPVDVASTDVGATVAGAPDNLRVSDRVRHLNVEGAPLFSWHPHDSGGNQVQTAYQLQVRLESSGAQVWDSGKVVSPEQSYVVYGGPELMPGESYTWVVRTWNRGDSVSSWSATARFDTALGNSAQAWGASWIRRSTSEADDYTLARAERSIGPTPIRRARAYVSANHQFELHVNGQIADRGPAFAYPGEAYYQASDITGMVQAGSPLAVGVIYHWYGSGQGRPAGSSGLLVRVMVEHMDGSRDILVSDGTWRVQRASQWQTGAPVRNGDSGDYVELMDIRAMPDGWNKPGFDATGWATPQTGTFPAIRPQEPRLRITEVPPVTVRTLGDGTVVADFGNVMPARPVVKFASGVAGRTINMLAGYRLASDGHVSTGNAQGSNLSFRFTQKAGAQEFRPTSHFGWRYFQISSPGETLAASAISALVEHTDISPEHAAQFESSDATLNSVFALVRRSAIYSVQQQFVDTPTREKGQFLGDTVNISLATMSAWLERDATQKAILEFANSQTRFWPDGRMNAVYPNGDGKRDIPDYTQQFPIWVWRYYMQSGDRTLLARVYPNMQRIADYVWNYRNGTTGLITNLAGGGGGYLGGIVDWPVTERKGYDMGVAARTTVNAFAVDLFRSTAAAAEALGRPPTEAMTYSTRADQITTAINTRLRRTDGIYVDGATGTGMSGHASQHANAYALAFGIVPADRRAAVADYAGAMSLSMGPMTAHWLTRGLSLTERTDTLVKTLTDSTKPGWANLLSRGGTFTWEGWEAATNGQSESHGWGSTVVVDILETLLGIRVISPGAATVGIRPPKTGLTFARGVVHTQRGAVKADWARQGSTGLTLSIEVPMNVRAEVALPATDLAMTTASGAGAPKHRETAGGWVIYDVGSGQSMFTVR